MFRCDIALWEWSITVHSDDTKYFTIIKLKEDTAALRLYTS